MTDKEKTEMIKHISKYILIHKFIVDKIKAFKAKYDNDGNKNIYEGFIRNSDFNEIVKAFIICRDQNIVFDDNEILPDDYLFTLYGIPIYKIPFPDQNIFAYNILLLANPIDNLIDRYMYSLDYKEKDVGKDDVFVPEWVYAVIAGTEYISSLMENTSVNEILDRDGIRNVPFGLMSDNIVMDEFGFLNVPINLEPIDPDNIEGEDD